MGRIRSWRAADGVDRTEAVAVQPSTLERRESIVRARAAAIGATVVRAENAAGQIVFAFTRWGYTRELPHVAHVETLLDRMGAPK